MFVIVESLLEFTGGVVEDPGSRRFVEAVPMWQAQQVGMLKWSGSNVSVSLL